MKCSVFIASSLDGFIARVDGSIDWLNEASASFPAGEDGGFSHFMSSVDAIIMGRNTFAQVLSFGQWPYGITPVVVLSRQLKDLPPELPDSVSLSTDEPDVVVKKLTAKGLEHLYVDGGITIQRFLAAGLIDEFIITWIPILIGNGKPLFGELIRDVKLELRSSETFEPGFIQTRYSVLK